MWRPYSFYIRECFHPRYRFLRMAVLRQDRLQGPGGESVRRRQIHLRPGQRSDMVSPEQPTQPAQEHAQRTWRAYSRIFCHFYKMAEQYFVSAGSAEPCYCERWVEPAGGYLQGFLRQVPGWTVSGETDRFILYRETFDNCFPRWDSSFSFKYFLGIFICTWQRILNIQI